MTMRLSITLAPGGGYAVVVVGEDVTNELAVEAGRLQHEFAAARGVTRFLVDARGRRYAGTPSSHQEFVTDQLPAESYGRAWRVAVLASPGDGSHDFLETAAGKAGYGIRVFKDYDEAVRWLTGD